MYAYGPYVREIEEWGELFSKVVIAAPCREAPPAGDALAFAHKNIAVVPMPEFSGGGLLGRLRDAIALPRCLLRLCRLLWQADAVHVRCPGSMGLLGVLLAPAVFRVKRVLGRDASNVQRPTSNVQRSTSKSEFAPDSPCLTPETLHLTTGTPAQPQDHKPRTTDHGPQITHHASRITHSLPLIAKYAGQWNGYPGEAWTYRLQRWLLKSRWWGAPVTVYGEWPNQPRHVIPFFTSVLTEQQMGLARESAQRKAEMGKAESRNSERGKQKQSETHERRPDIRAPNAVRGVEGAGGEHGARSTEAEDQSPKRSARGGCAQCTPSLSAATAFVPGSVGHSDSARHAPCSVRCADSPLRVLYVGRLSAAKHVDAVIAAVAAVRATGLAVECTIVGDGPERERLEALATEDEPEFRITDPESRIPNPGSPITDHGSLITGQALRQAQGLRHASTSRLPPPWLRFAGGLPFDQVLDCYREHDVLVLASETEGWPKAIAEAMAFGLICIGSNRSIIPQMLGDGRGFLVEPGDRAALIAHLREIAAMPASERAAMSRRAAEWGQRYTLENLREALRNLMEEWWGGAACNNSMAG